MLCGREARGKSIALGWQRLFLALGRLAVLAAAVLLAGAASTDLGLAAVGSGSSGPPLPRGAYLMWRHAAARQHRETQGDGGQQESGDRHDGGRPGPPDHECHMQDNGDTQTQLSVHIAQRKTHFQGQLLYVLGAAVHLLLQRLGRVQSQTTSHLR